MRDEKCYFYFVFKKINQAKGSGFTIKYGSIFIATSPDFCGMAVETEGFRNRFVD